MHERLSQSRVITPLGHRSPQTVRLRGTRHILPLTITHRSLTMAVRLGESRSWCVVSMVRTAQTERMALTVLTVQMVALFRWFICITVRVVRLLQVPPRIRAAPFPRDGLLLRPVLPRLTSTSSFPNAQLPMVLMALGQHPLFGRNTE